MTEVVENLLKNGPRAVIEDRQVDATNLPKEIEAVKQKNFMDRRTLRDNIDHWLLANPSAKRDTVTALKKLQSGIELNQVEENASEVTNAGKRVVDAAKDEFARATDSTKPGADRALRAGTIILGGLGVLWLAKKIYNWTSGGEEGGWFRKALTAVGITAGATYLVNKFGKEEDKKMVETAKRDVAGRGTVDALAMELKNSGRTSIELSDPRLKPGMNLLRLNAGIQLKDVTTPGVSTEVKFGTRGTESVLVIGSDNYRLTAQLPILGKVNLSELLVSAEVFVDPTTAKRYVKLKGDGKRSSSSVVRMAGEKDLYVEEGNLAKTINAIQANPSQKATLTFLQKDTAGRININGTVMKEKTQEVTPEKI